MNLECFFDKKDWRLCTATTEALKKCMEVQQTERRRKHNLSKWIEWLTLERWHNVLPCPISSVIHNLCRFISHLGQPGKRLLKTSPFICVSLLQVYYWCYKIILFSWFIFLFAWEFAWIDWWSSGIHIFLIDPFQATVGSCWASKFSSTCIG